ncbi:MAG TPA: glycosyl hydrolase family 28-related protein [Candidatus Saccharimonadales bacterium]|nr:glycosyl hydrolase family 28-related protein [Candidatus Saccharimonadales bacterium]
MARLPVPGGDADDWASILNEYLRVTHNEDGTQKTDSINSAALQSRSIGIRHFRTTNPSGASVANMVLSNNGNDLVWRTVQGASGPPSQQLRINVADYGAIGDGLTDDTAAIQSAIDAAAGGGAVEFPRGVFLVRQLKINNKGTTLVGAARFGSRIVRHSGTLPLIDMSGPSTMAGHLRYCSLINLMVDGNNMPGPLVRSYYADNLLFRDVNFIHCQDMAIDLVEVWDTRFNSCAWENCGSVSSPAVLLRNSMPQGQFGYSTDNTNQIHFIACRWEGYRNGAIRLDGEANGSTAKLNGIFFVSCKMESSVLAGIPFQIMGGTNIVFVSQLYIAMMARDSGYTDTVDAIEDHGSQVFMTNVYVQWGAAAGLANSVAHIKRGAPHMYHEISTYYPTDDPVTATILVEPEANEVMVSCLWTNRGRQTQGEIHEMLEFEPHHGLTLPLHAPGSFRVTHHMTGKDLVKVDANDTRPALIMPNGVDAAGFSDAFATEKWRVVGATGAARFAGGRFQIEATKGYVGINTTPYIGIAMLIRAAVEGDRGLAIVRPSGTATNRLLEFQDETYNIQGMAIDSNGRPVAVGTPPRVTAGDQATYANPRVQVRDIAGSITAAVRPSPTAPGTIATVTFSRPYVGAPLCIILSDHSEVPGDLYVSQRSASGFTVATRSALRGGSILNFDYAVTA